MNENQVNFLKLMTLLILFVLPLSCTKSPFGENEISGGNSTLKGLVKLDTNEVAKNAIVWLEGINIGARTDENGEFNLQLPAPGSQGGTTGYSGTLTLYCFMGNCNVGTARVGLRNGTFLAGDKNLDQNGKLKDPIYITKTLDVEVRTSPDRIKYGETSSVLVEVILTATSDSVRVWFPGVVNGLYGPMVITKVDIDSSQVVSTTITGIYGTNEVLVEDNAPIRRSFILGAGNFKNETAQYLITPFLLVRKTGVPQGLLDYIGFKGDYDIEHFGAIPFEVTNSSLSVFDNKLDSE